MRRFIEASQQVPCHSDRLMCVQRARTYANLCCALRKQRNAARLKVTHQLYNLRYGRFIRSFLEGLTAFILSRLSIARGAVYVANSCNVVLSLTPRTLQRKPALRKLSGLRRNYRCLLSLWQPRGCQNAKNKTSPPPSCLFFLFSKSGEGC